MLHDGITLSAVVILIASRTLRMKLACHMHCLHPAKRKRSASLDLKLFLAVPGGAMMGPRLTPSAPERALPAHCSQESPLR
jgi:hypothetical protein